MDFGPSSDHDDLCRNELTSVNNYSNPRVPIAALLGIKLCSSDAFPISTPARDPTGNQTASS